MEEPDGTVTGTCNALYRSTHGGLTLHYLPGQASELNSNYE